MNFLKVLTLFLVLFSFTFLDNGKSFAQTTTNENSPTNLQQITNPEPASAQLNPADAEPAQAQMGVIKHGINLYCTISQTKGGVCELTRDSWGRGFVFQNLVIDQLYMAACDGKDQQEAMETGKCIDEAAFVADAYDTSALADGQSYRMKGELGAMLASSMTTMSTEPPVPTDLALFIQDATRDTILPGTPAYAQTGGFNESYRRLILSAWKLTRNIALALLGAFVGFAALMVMFRSKLDPRTSVTIYNVLPMIPICLGLILLSYPLMSLAIATIGPLEASAIAIGRALVNSTYSNVGADTLGRQYADGVNAVLTLLTGGVLTIALVFFTALVIAALIVLGIYLLYKWLSIYVSLMITTILSPIIVLLALLPGKSALIMNLVKKTLADIFAIPFFIITAWFGLAIIVYAPNDESVFMSGAGITTTIIFLILKYFFAILIIIGGLGSHNKLKKMLGVGNMWGNDPPKR